MTGLSEEDRETLRLVTEGAYAMFIPSFASNVVESVRDVMRARDRAEAALVQAEAALNYVSAPTMGLPAGVDAAAFAMSGATEQAARYALHNCIHMAREALAARRGTDEEGAA